MEYSMKNNYIHLSKVKSSLKAVGLMSGDGIAELLDIYLFT